MRIAWQGPLAAEGGGAAYVGLQVLQGLRSLGVEVDCYTTRKPADMPAAVREDSGIVMHSKPARWEWNRWYSRDPLSAFVTGQSANGLAQLALARLIAEEHRRRPYDILYRFSQIELFGVRRLRSALPPIVVHPGVHAAGELAWHRREDALAARTEARQRRLAVRAMLIGRAARQRRDIRLVRRVISPSHVFASHLSCDYGIPLDHISVVPNPIDLHRFVPRPSLSSNGHNRPITLLFVSRLSVRKGVDLVVGLSRRLEDLAGQVRIEVIGNPTLWSDYGALLEDLNPAIAHYTGPLADGPLAEAYANADALIQPSKYEPFALTVGEALACGVPVVASDEVGATEGVDRGCCSVFRSGDLSAFEASVRALVARISNGAKPSMSRLARTEAQRLFSPERVAQGVVESLNAALCDGAKR